MLQHSSIDEYGHQKSHKIIIFIAYENENWRKGWDSNPRYALTHAGFQDRCLKPLGHPSLPADWMPYKQDAVVLSSGVRQESSALCACPSRRGTVEATDRIAIPLRNEV